MPSTTSRATDCGWSRLNAVRTWDDTDSIVVFAMHKVYSAAKACKAAVELATR